MSKLDAIGRFDHEYLREGVVGRQLPECPARESQSDQPRRSLDGSECMPQGLPTLTIAPSFGSRRQVLLGDDSRNTNNLED